MENQNKIPVIIDKKNMVGIVDADFPVSLEETIESVKEAAGETKVHFVDFCGWQGSEKEIRERLSKEGYEIDDHHNGFNTNDVLTATSSVKARQDRKEIGSDGKIILTFRSNFDGDLIFSTYMAQNPESKHRELVEAAAVFSDCTMFGGQAMERSYSPATKHETLAFALNQLIYDEIVSNFPQDKRFLKGFPAKLPGITEAVLKSYSDAMEKLPALIEDVCSSGEKSGSMANAYLQRVQKVYEEVLLRGVETIPGKAVYIDLQPEPLDKEAPMPFWIAEGNGEYTKGKDGKMRPMVIVENKAGYVIGSADTRRKPGDSVEYDLTLILPQLNSLGGQPWFGKSNVLLTGPGKKNATQEQITEIIRQAYKL